MLLNFHNLINKYNLKITGVIQAGAHYGEELVTFIANGIERGYLFEPCKEAFEVLKKISPKGFNAINYALASKADGLKMYKETVNNGQSNSALRPKKHLTYYPDIVFESTEIYLALPLDFYEIKDCNLLVMDVQGFELEVLKGANMRCKTLQHIDYIYSELNREEMYEGCAMVDDIDNYLSDFTRVETKWTRKGYGDGFYIRKTLL